MAATTPDRAVSGALSPGEFGPRVAGGKPRNGGPDWLRVGFMAVAIVLVFAVGMGGYYSFLIWRATSDVAGDFSIGEGPTFVPAPDASGGGLELPEVTELEDRSTILLIGSDSREGLTDEQLAAIGTESTGTDLTDTIILLQIDPNTDAAAMLSFPRDLLVERCDGTRGRINEAFYIGLLQADQQEAPESQRSEYGAACLIDTIQTLTGGIEVDHYARVNFAGFVGAVDALGGVSFYVEEDLRDRYSGLDVEAGCVDFDGVTAIQFVRARRLDSDFGRIARQQRFAREMVRKASSLGTLLNPVTVTNLVRSVASSLETDADFGISQMADLASSISGISAGTVDGRTVPGYVGTWGEASVVRLLEDEAEELFAAFRNGDLLPDGVGQDAQPVELGPTNLVPIVVSAGGADLETAERTAAVLEALGYTVEEVTETDNSSFSGSIVFHPEMRADHAEYLADALGGLQVSELGEEDDHLMLVLGSAFDPEEFAPPEATETPSEEGSPEPSSTPTEEEFAGAALSEIEC